MTFLELYGTKLDRELGTADRVQRFTTALRKEYVNEGQRKFNEQTSCYIKRFAIALIDGTAEYDLEATGTITDADYLWPSKTDASLRRYDGAGTANTDYTYVEGPELPYKTEQELNQTRSGWRAEADGVPTAWTLRPDGGSFYLVLVPAPDVPAGETWTLYWPYVAQPADMTSDTHEPYGLASSRTTLRPYHDAILAYAAAQCEKLRKNYEGMERQMKFFAAGVSKYHADQQPQRGSSIRLAQDYRRRLRSARPVSPFTGV